MGPPRAVVRPGAALMPRPPGHYLPNPRDRARQRAAELRALLTEKTPCQDCSRRNLCATFYLACSTFRNWTATGSWRIGDPREPSREIYQKLFSNNDED